MKKFLFPLMVSLLAACSSHPEIGQPQAPLDMNTVEAYNTKVYSGKTTTIKVAERPVNLPLNASDNRPRQSTKNAIPVVLMPSIGYHYGHYRRHW